MRTHVGGFVLHTLILLILFLSVIDNIFLFGGKIFWMEIIAITGLVLMAGLSMRRYAKQGSRALLFVYGALLLDVIVLSSIASEIFWLSLVFAAGGLVVSLRKKERRQDDFSDVRVEEVKPETVLPEASVQPVVESRVITERPARMTKKAPRKKAKRKR